MSADDLAIIETNVPGIVVTVSDVGDQGAPYETEIWYGPAGVNTAFGMRFFKDHTPEIGVKTLTARYLSVHRVNELLRKERRGALIDGHTEGRNKGLLVGYLLGCVVTFAVPHIARWLG